MTELTVLALTTRRKVDRDLARRLLKLMELGDSIRVELISVHAPSGRLPFARVDVVDPSMVPFRPVIPVSGEGAQDWGGGARLAARALRAGRRAGTKSRRLLGRGPRDIDSGRALEIACRTSPGLGERAAAVDVVVPLEPTAVRGAAALAARSDRPVVASKPMRVREVLQLHGVPLPPRPREDGAVRRGGAEAMPAPPEPVARRVLIAPANYAGQAGRWAEAIRRYVPDATAMNAQAWGHPKFPFACDYDIGRARFTGDLEWRLEWRKFVREHFSHVVIEANRTILGSATSDGQLDATEMQRAGKVVAMLSHGSDARIPSVHKANEPWHSYDALATKALVNLERAAQHNCDVYNSFDGTVFVSTPGLIAFIPRAVWLPLVIDVDRWHRDEEPLTNDVPVVAHIPSSPQKGSHLIDPILSAMHERGQIRYRRVQGVPHAKMPKLYGTADIVVEQFGIADYSTAAVEAMAAGRVVVSRVADSVREHVRETTGRDLPIVEGNPTTLEQVILDLAADRERAREVARQGEEFAREIHDGRRSAAVLGAWLDSTS